jgi:hypothetical protein
MQYWGQLPFKDRGLYLSKIRMQNILVTLRLHWNPITLVLNSLERYRDKLSDTIIFEFNITFCKILSVLKLKGLIN